MPTSLPGALWGEARGLCIAKLPPQVKKLIKLSTKGKELTPADYDKLFAIAKKIENLPSGLVNDYASKVTGATTDLDKFEATLDKYIADAAEREKEGAERDTIKTKLLGLEEVYKKYRTYKTLLTTSSISAAVGPFGGVGGGLGAGLAAMKVRKELDADVKRHGFASLSAFEAYIRKFEKAFETESAHIANDLLAKYQGKLYRESVRYQDRAEVQALHGQLGGVRAEYAAQQKHQKEVNRLHRQRMMGANQAYVPPKSQNQKDEEAKVKAHKEGTKLEVAKLARTNPVFNEEHLPSDKQIDKGKLATADVDGLQSLLLAYIASKNKDAAKARGQIAAKPELIYKMDKLLPLFYARQGIRPGSIHDMIIQDKMKSDAITKLVKGIVLAVVAIALAVVSLGTATPAIIAAGAAIAGAGLGAYAAYEEYQEYTQEKGLADVGFAKDPSVVWLVIAIAGAGLDMAAAVKAVSALGKAAKALDAGGDLADFTKVVRELEKAGQIESKIARAAEKAARARKGFAEASTELTKAMTGKVYSFPGPLADPDVYKAVVKMARQAIKTKAYDAQKFIEELKLARIKAKFGDLTPEELVKAKQAWEEAKLLEAAADAKYQTLLGKFGGDATKLDALIAKAGDVDKLERLLKVFPASELESIFAKVTDGGRVLMMLDHVGAESGAKMIRQWMSKGKIGKMNQFLERMAGGVSKQLAETTRIGAKSMVIDSNTAIALMKDADPALRGTMQAGEKARVAYIKSLPADTELRVGNVTVGEIKGGVLGVKGVPIDVARHSAEYKKVLKALENAKVGGGPGIADRALIADVLVAKTKPGVIPRFMTGDREVVNKLASLAGIDVVKIGGFKGILAKYGSSGFDVTIEGRTLTVIPVK